jgi:hypothetical protein
MARSGNVDLAGACRLDRLEYIRVGISKTSKTSKLLSFLDLI